MQLLLKVARGILQRRSGHDEVVNAGRHVRHSTRRSDYARPVTPPTTGRAAASDLGVGAGAGIIGGLFGVGGGLVLVPYLVLVRHWPQKQAQATSLVAVAMSALAGGITYALAESVVWSAAAVIVVGGLVGAVLGSALVRRLHAWSLQLAFAMLLVVTAVKVGLTPDAAELSAVPSALTPALAVGYLAAGLAMGVLSALFGIGGGLLLVPILVALFGYSPTLAAGTSLVVMVLIALVGAVRQTGPGFTRWSRGAVLGAAAVVGAIVGARMALVLPLRVLTVGFALLLAVVALRMAITGWRARFTTA